MDAKIPKEYEKTAYNLFEVTKAKRLPWPIWITPQIFEEAINLYETFILVCYKDYTEYKIMNDVLWELIKDYKERKDFSVGFGEVDMNTYPKFFEREELRRSLYGPRTIIEMIRSAETPFIIFFRNGEVIQMMPSGLILLIWRRSLAEQISNMIVELNGD